MLAIKHRKIFYLISTVLVVLSLAFVFTLGLKPGIDFTGGSMLEVTYPSGAPAQSVVAGIVREQGFENAVIRDSGENGYFVKLPTIDVATKINLKAALSFSGTQVLEEKRFNTVGPTLGRELTTKASVALLIVVLAIILYVAYVFRKVSKPVSSWKYGFVAIIALVHDIVITLGFFALAGYFVGTEIDTLFITALLVILGYSVNDSIVVLDRVRENLNQLDEKQRPSRFIKIVGKSLKEALARSINTSITTLLALVALFAFGGEVTREFALALIIGVIAGAYSSIFLAAPLLVTFKERLDKRPPKPTKKEA